MADDTNTAECDALGFFLEERGNTWVVQFKEGGCRPATIPEKALWLAFQAGRASLAASAGSEPVAGGAIAEVVMTVRPPNASPAWLPHKIIYASLQWLDSVPVGTKLYTHPSPPEGAGWISVKDRLPPPFEEVWVHPRPSDYCCEACVDTAGNWKYSEYETNFGVNHIKCEVEYWMPAPPLASEAKGASHG